MLPQALAHYIGGLLFKEARQPKRNSDGGQRIIYSFQVKPQPAAVGRNTSGRHIKQQAVETAKIINWTYGQLFMLA